jgi:hypothetical protein
MPAPASKLKAERLHAPSKLADAIRHVPPVLEGLLAATRVVEVVEMVIFVTLVDVIVC